MSADMRAAGEQALAVLERYSDVLGNASAALIEGLRDPVLRAAGSARAAVRTTDGAA